MRKQPNNKLIGLFIVCGFVLFLATIGMFVAEKVTADRKNLVVMYFSESIKGLDVGSQVVFKGVNIGRVAKIDLITDAGDMSFSIPVYVAFNRQNFLRFSMYLLNVPWRPSRSMTATEKPSCISMTARCMEIVDLPVPPFSLLTTMVCARCGAGDVLIILFCSHNHCIVRIVVYDYTGYA